jgi:hypothetical protein
LHNLGLSLNGDGKHMMELAEKIIDEEGVSVDFGKAKKTDSQQSD